MTTKPISVIVVNHNGGEEVLECLSSVAAEQPVEIVVVDNGSTDDSDRRIRDQHRSTVLISNPRNLGFAAAANQGVRASGAPYVFLVNADARVSPGSLDALVRVLDDHPRAAAVGALVRNPDGSVQPTKRAFPSIGQSILHGLLGIFRPDNPGTRAYVLSEEDFTRERKVDWVSGPATALRRDAFDAVGGFDERFFFFVEDVDLCKRLSDAGWEIWFSPGAEVTHRWGGSWTKRPLPFLWLHQRNLFRYVVKHYRGGWVLAYPVIALGLLIRFMLLALRWMITGRSVPKHRHQPGRSS